MGASGYARGSMQPAVASDPRRLGAALLLLIYAILLVGAGWPQLIREGYTAMSESAVEGWRLALWQLDYRHEFGKRALPGAVLGGLGIPRTAGVVWALSFSAAMTSCGVLVWLWWRRLAAQPPRTALLLLGVFVASPASAMHLGYDAGRFDHFTLLIAIICVALILEGPTRLATFVVPPLIAVGLLIHEAFLLIGLPLIATTTWWRSADDPGHRRLFFAEMAVALLTLMPLLLYGDASEASLRAALSDVARVAPGDTLAASSLTVLNAGVARSIRMAGWAWSQPFTWLYMAVVLPLLLALGWLYLAAIELRRRRGGELGVALAPLSVLVLFGLGLDFYRWMALGLMLSFVVLLVLGPTSPGISRIAGTRRGWVALTVAFGTAFLGPLGVTNPFPAIDTWLLGLAGLR